MLKQKDYENESFRNEEFENEIFSGFEFQDCEFINCNFASAAFDKSLFISCAFTECDLSLLKVDGSIFKDVQFYKSKVIGVNWAAANWRGNTLIQIQKTLSFIDCVLNYSYFSGLDMENVQIENCIAHEVNFAEANLKGANLRKTDLEKSIFQQTSLEEADLMGASNYIISPASNKLKKAKFSMPEAMSLLYSMDIVIKDYGDD